MFFSDTANTDVPNETPAKRSKREQLNDEMLNVEKSILEQVAEVSNKLDCMNSTMLLMLNEMRRSNDIRERQLEMQNYQGQSRNTVSSLDLSLSRGATNFSCNENSTYFYNSM